jgi:hypothetical protein
MQKLLKPGARCAPLLATAFCLCGISACQPTAQYSGFLSDYSQLRPSRVAKNALDYRNPRISLLSYKKFLLEPYRVHFAANAEGISIDPAQLKNLVEYFRNETIKALSKRYRVVDRPGSGVARIRVAITSITKTRPVANNLPQGKLLGVGLGGASMEAEAFDSVTGERLLAIVETGVGKHFSFSDATSRYGHAKQVMRQWIDRFIRRLDLAHGYRASS